MKKFKEGDIVRCSFPNYSNITCSNGLGEVIGYDEDGMVGVYFSDLDGEGSNLEHYSILNEKVIEKGCKENCCYWFYETEMEPVGQNEFTPPTLITKKDVVKWLIKNFEEDGEINLSNLDFSDYDGDINIRELKAKGDVFIDGMNVKGSIYQNDQTALGEIDQSYQTAGVVIHQAHQEAPTIEQYGNSCTNLYTQNTNDYTLVESNGNCVQYIKKKRMTLEQVQKELGYEIEIVEEEN